MFSQYKVPSFAAAYLTKEYLTCVRSQKCQQTKNCTFELLSARNHIWRTQHANQHPERTWSYPKLSFLLLRINAPMEAHSWHYWYVPKAGRHDRKQKLPDAMTDTACSTSKTMWLRTSGIKWPWTLMKVQLLRYGPQPCDFTSLLTGTQSNIRCIQLAAVPDTAASWSLHSRINHWWGLLLSRTKAGNSNGDKPPGRRQRGILDEHTMRGWKDFQ